MKEVNLYFPTTIQLADFILLEKITGVQTTSLDCSLKGLLSDKQIMVAYTTYEAIAVTMHPVLME